MTEMFAHNCYGKTVDYVFMIYARVYIGLFCIKRPEYESFAQNCYGKTFIDARFGDVERNPFYRLDLGGLF